MSRRDLEVLLLEACRRRTDAATAVLATFGARRLRPRSKSARRSPRNTSRAHNRSNDLNEPIIVGGRIRASLDVERALDALNSTGLPAATFGEELACM